MVDTETQSDIARVVRENGHIVIVMPDSFETSAEELVVSVGERTDEITLAPRTDLDRWNAFVRYRDSLNLSGEEWDEFATDMYDVIANRDFSESRDIFGDDEG
ncbi:MAG: hypothetical protein QM753_16210 [Thermomicrobiales bacterium]